MVKQDTLTLREMERRTLSLSALTVTGCPGKPHRRLPPGQSDSKWELQVAAYLRYIEWS